MNARLVESIAQIVLAMSAEERQLFEQIVSPAVSESNNKESTPQKSEAALNKDTQIAQIAQQMQDFEENHSMPLSPLPDDDWGV